MILPSVVAAAPRHHPDAQRLRWLRAYEAQLVKMLEAVQDEIGTLQIYAYLRARGAWTTN